MEHDAEERTPSKTSKGPKIPVSEGEETAPTRTAKHTGRGHKRDAKTPRHTAGSNKEEAVPKDRDHGRKIATQKRRGSSKNRETGSTPTKLKRAAATEAPQAGVPSTPATARYPERAASTAAETSDHQRNEPGDDRIQASRGADETNVPPGDPSAAASANADVSGSLPPAGGSGKDNTRPDSSSETKAAVPAESNSGNVGTAVPTQQATSLVSEKEQATRIIRDKVASKQEAMPAKTAVPDAEVAATRRKFRQARWITRMSTAKAMGNPSESRNLSPHIAKRIPASWNAVLLFVSLVLLTLAAYLMFRKDSKKVYYDTCKTLACEEFSRRLLDSINRSVSPCVSFDHYVCDGWRATHDLSVREDSFQSILGRLYRNVRDMDVPKRGQDDKQRAAAFYRSCECVGKGDCDELPVVLRALKDAGVPWPHRAPKRIRVLKTMLFTSVNLRWGGILAFEFSRGPGERRVFLRLAEEFNLLKWKWDEHRLSPGSRERYFEVLRDRYAGAGSSSATKKTSAALVTYEETQQVESVMLQKLFQTAPAIVTTLGGDIMYNTVPGLTETLWESALGLYFARLKATGAVVFHTDAGNLVQQLLEMWRDHGERAFHLLLSWCTVQLAALYANQQLIDNFYGSRGKAEVAHGVSCFSKAFRIVGEQILDGCVQ
ncbi:hypothetical protein HPB50_015116 [Hyalomma asiaticum]|uniref:Uncharacterized protein n=1 Tax=Hyalomma asiaticum TaxID=266040 RepID=A0ACB7T523_HYAAI|nr:hypothetical protein HPB50_015116 [Hyalomma asiaticum]